jgi:hypothetical protein
LPEHRYNEQVTGEIAAVYVKPVESDGRTYEFHEPVLRPNKEGAAVVVDILIQDLSIQHFMNPAQIDTFLKKETPVAPVPILIYEPLVERYQK